MNVSKQKSKEKLVIRLWSWNYPGDACHRVMDTRCTQLYSENSRGFLFPKKDNLTHKCFLG